MNALPLDADCVGLWRFDEALATDSAVDAGPNGYDLTGYGSPAVITPGVVGARMRRIVNGDIFRLFPAANLRTLESVTMAAIIVPLSSFVDNHPSFYRPLVYMPLVTTTYWWPTYGIKSKTGGRFDFQIEVKLAGESLVFHCPASPPVLTPDVGHLVVGTFSKASKLLSWSVDGALVEEVSTAPYDTLEYASDPTFVIGANDFFINAGIQYFAGCDIDEVGIYSSAKPANWGKAIYASTALALNEGPYHLITDGRDYEIDGSGQLTRDKTIASRCRARVLCHRGKWAVDPAFGSRLWTIKTMKRARHLAVIYIEEALADLIAAKEIEAIHPLEFIEDQTTGALGVRVEVVLPREQVVPLGVIPLGE